jgi:hypothetical protein
MKIYLILVILLLYGFGFAQSISDQESIVISKNQEDSIANHTFPEIEISTDNDAYLKKYRKTKYFVTRVYAYSQIASNMFLSFQDTLEFIDSKRLKKKYLNRVNKILKAEFGDEIRDMSITRGEYLMKLIYRETGLTTYDIIKFYRGNGKAFWFQALCKINGQDLKREYDPLGEDFLIEKVVNEIENGKLSYVNRSPKTKAGKKSRRKRNIKKKKSK